MAVLINFKMCDNAKECGGIAVCPTKALSWDEKEETIKIDNDKCISCGLCENECPIGAISVAKTKEEYEKTKKEIDEDPRTTKDLFVDRYGAAPLSDFFTTTEDDLKNKIKNDNITLIELYIDDSIQCLLKSIPIKELSKDLPKDTLYYKLESNDKLKKQYKINEYPSLLIFKNNNLLGKIEGYYTTDEKEKLIKNINDLINKNN